MMGTNSDVVSPGLRSYLTGFALAVPLTVIPFALAATGYFPNAVTLRVIAIAAIAQVLVHLRDLHHIRLTHRRPTAIRHVLRQLTPIKNRF